MRLSRSKILIITCMTCLGFDPSSASASTHDQAPEILKLAFVSSTDIANQSILDFGTTGREVEGLQTKLKELGYYDGLIDGLYGNSTRLAVSKFQEAKSLKADGIVGTTTKEKLEAITNTKPPLSLVTSSTPNNKTAQPESEQQGLVWWSLVGIGILGMVGALLYFLQWYRKVKKVPNRETSDPETKNRYKTELVTPPLQELDTKTDQQSNSTPPPTTVLPLETTSRLAKVNIVDQLINDLHSPDPTQRRKAIWDLGQQGDSRAIQPLVDLMIHADSQQRSLILAALSEIGIRTLKPMNRALALSLQDESPQVRQNAIRDLTRVYDSMAQISQMLSHAAQDPDAEVQATARYALSQMNRIRALPEKETESERKKESKENNQKKNF